MQGGALDEAANSSPIITAPFAGFITVINVKGGDEVNKNTAALQLADPDEFEVDILVGELDILQVTMGGDAWVEVDAVSGVSLPAKVTHISQAASIQSGVVNYQVTVEVESLEMLMQGQQQEMGEMGQGELSDLIEQAIEEGRMTREQAEEMMDQMEQGQSEWQGQMPATTLEDLQLRAGLTTAVSITIDERVDVLLVPNSAITIQGRQTYVQVLSTDGTIEDRMVTTGISDWQYTEVTDGLMEGEQVIVPQGTIASVTQQSEFRGGMMPGMGGILR